MQGWAVELQFQLLPSQTLRATPDGSVRKGKKEEEKCRQVDRRTRKKTLCFYWPTLFSLSEIIQKNHIFV